MGIWIGWEKYRGEFSFAVVISSHDHTLFDILSSMQPFKRMEILKFDASDACDACDAVMQ